MPARGIHLTICCSLFRLEQALSRQSEKQAEEVKQLEEESARQQDSIQELQKVRACPHLHAYWGLLRSLAV